MTGSSSANDAACAACSDGASTQELWDGTWIGMREAEVRARYPAAQAPFLALVNTSNWLQMKGPVLAEQASTVTFYFKQGRLDSVRVAPEHKPSHGGALQMAERIVITLREKYGEEHTAAKTPDLWGSYTRHVWLDRAIKIVMHLHVTYAAEVPSANLWLTYSGEQVKV
jgi:hypothetical protein